MKVLQINIFGNLSTGRVAVDLYKTLVAKGGEGCVAFARNTIAEDIPHIHIGTDLDVKLHGIMTRLTDKTGFYSTGATKKLIKQIKEYRPDLIHLHNIHGYYLNIELLFEYLKNTQIPVVWTLHDCWSYTGHCCYYSLVQCNKWQTGCFDCQQKRAYPASVFIDNSKWNYQKKKKLFAGINMTLVAVSQWLANEVGQSFLKDYPLKTIYNGIDLNVFRPLNSDFRNKHSLKNKKIILGVASTWDVRKGLDDFIKLSAMLDDNYKIVVVGVNAHEMRMLPKNIIGIKRTDSIQELAEIYSAADIFFNASVEETFGLPTVEAMACGTPSIVYNSTALPELIMPGCGYVVQPHDLNQIVKILKEVNKSEMSVACLHNAQIYDRNKKYAEYIELYQKILQRH